MPSVFIFKTKSINVSVIYYLHQKNRKGIRIRTEGSQKERKMRGTCVCRNTWTHTQCTKTTRRKGNNKKYCGFNDTLIRVVNFCWKKYSCFCLEISVQFSSVAHSCPTLCNPMNCSTPGLPVHHQLPEFTQTYINRVGDAIQPSHPLSSPSPPAPDPSQHQGLFQWVNSSHEVAKVLEFQLQHQSFMNTQDWSPLAWTGWISLQSKGLSRVFSNTTVQKHHFFRTQLSSQSNSHIHTWPLEKP